MPRFSKELPEKYYLDHFNEFIDFITKQCGHLLDQTHQEFVTCYLQLCHDTQCMFVRVINRKGRFITQDKMIYHEITDCPSQLSTLQKVALLRPLNSEDIQGWLPQLTKLQLVDILQQYAVSNIKKSAAKAILLEQLTLFCSIEQCLTSRVAQQVLVKNFEPCLAYLLFLFFGNTSSKLDKFSMRDLGVLTTRKGNSEPSSRFNHFEQAQCVFYYSTKLAQLKANALNVQEYLSTYKKPDEHPSAHNNCAQSNQVRGEYFYLLGKQLLVHNNSLAMEYLRASCHPKAQQRWLRELFKQGEKDRVKYELEQIIDNSLDDGLLLFAEDFYQRKFHQVKVSELTQKLREESYDLAIDQIHKDQVEKGVKQYYQRLGASAFRTENRLFNALFALTFWEELFNHADAVATEFDRRPKVVKENAIYHHLEHEVEQRLLMFFEPKRARAYLTKIATRYYGQPNGMFRWNTKMMQVITHFIAKAPVEAVIQHLRAMAKNFHGLSDGYPDLMIIENGQLRFEEVKAPGDVIRPNQFVTMNALQVAGFDVRVCRVDWIVDPMQPYVIVDVETTGGKQPHHRITEVGAVKMINGEVVDTWSSLINPQRHISKFITQLTGISNDMVKDAPVFSEVADNLSQFTENCVFVAHNVNFDYGFIKQEYQRLDRNFSMAKLCTVREMRKAYPGLHSYSLGNLCETYNISLANHHRALCDAEAAAELLKMILHQQQKKS
ncbi:MAG: exonuclease domain-containing protein [Paraglaciecola sp.]|uniref:exonuclease domain-containing protein n=1 Tax=Paraglaciecola sp. TaxID=1920173 RepID=UPI003296E34C